MMIFPRARIALPDNSPKPGIVLPDEVEVASVKEEPLVEGAVEKEGEEKGRANGTSKLAIRKRS